MNCVANLPDFARYFIQQQNTKKKVTKTLPITVDMSGGEIIIDREPDINENKTIEDKVALLEVKPTIP